jgi:uncharacterized protein YjbI with pentapeptide repeats
VISPVVHPEPAAFGAWFKRIQGQRIGAESSLASKCLSFLNLNGTILDIADLYSANLDGSNLEGVAAHYTCLSQANLNGANLRNANFWRADLRDARLENADLRGADLQEADLRMARFHGVVYDNIRLLGARIDGLQPRNVKVKLEAEFARQEAEESSLGRSLQKVESIKNQAPLKPSSTEPPVG